MMEQPFSFQFFQLTSQDGGQSSGACTLHDTLLVLDQFQDRDRDPFLLHHHQFVDQRIRGRESVVSNHWHGQAICQGRIYTSIRRSIRLSCLVETGTLLRLDAL